MSEGLAILCSWSKEISSGESPPWTQNILSSIKAATGIQLNISENNFQIFKLYLLLPSNLDGVNTFVVESVDSVYVL